jgi:hypothetical protein
MQPYLQVPVFTPGQAVIVYNKLASVRYYGEVAGAKGITSAVMKWKLNKIRDGSATFNKRYE